MVFDKTHRFGFGLRQVSAVDILMRKKIRLVIVCSTIKYQSTSISGFEQEKILMNYNARLFNILDQIMNIQYAADWSDVLRKTNPIMFENRNRTNAF